MAKDHPKILVTGGAGFIGSHIVDRLIKENFEVTVIDNLTTGKIENLENHIDNKNFHFVKGDIQDVEVVKTVMEDIDAVIHEAAQTNVQLSLENPRFTNDVNVNGTLNLLKIGLDFNLKRFIYASSAAIYGDTGNSPVQEEQNPLPTSPYGASKRASEKYIEVFHHVYGLETVCLRYFNVYGSRQVDNPYSGVITKFVKQLVNNSPPTIYGDGNQTRDFVNIKDIVDANMLSLSEKSVVSDIFNIGTGQAVTIKNLVNILQQILDKKNLKPTYEKPRVGDIRYSCADISKARRLLHYYPKVSLLEGLTEFIVDLNL